MYHKFSLKVEFLCGTRVFIYFIYNVTVAFYSFSFSLVFSSFSWMGVYILGLQSSFGIVAVYLFSA